MKSVIVKAYTSFKDLLEKNPCAKKIIDESIASGEVASLDKNTIKNNNNNNPASPQAPTKTKTLK